MRVRQFLYLFLAFILFVPIGTVSHELGHYIVADHLGYEPTLHFDRVNYNTSDENERLLCIYSDNKEAIDNDLDFVGKKEYFSSRNKFKMEHLFMALGGVLQTLFVGTIGLILLLKKGRRSVGELDKVDWLFVFLSLFWLRQFFNLASAFWIGWYYRIEKYCGGDELQISILLDLPPCFISNILGLLGGLIGIYITFFVVPKKSRAEFIVAGVLGCGVGYYLWMEILGPIIIP